MHRLSHGSTVATIDRIVRSQRRTIKQIAVEYSQTGTPILDGPSYEQLIHTWEIESYCSQESTRALQAFEEEQISRIRAGIDPQFVLSDYKTEIVEPAPRKFFCHTYNFKRSIPNV